MALKRSATNIVQDDYKEIISLARKKFRREQPESSADSVRSHDTHIIFYDSFEEYPIILEGGYKISPRCWAQAFLQHDIKSITRVLCESIFTQTELDSRNCNSAHGGAKTLPHTKKLAILRAAKWLMNKNQDPWGFKPGPFPSEGEWQEIELIFETFDKVDSQCNNDNIWMETESDEEMPTAPTSPHQMELKSLPRVVIYDEDMDSPLEIVPPEDKNNYTEIFTSLARELIDSEYVDFYNKIMGWIKAGKTSSLGNSAQTAKALTKLVVCQNDDIFVDAVQFSKGRWAKAVLAQQTAQIEKCAEVLFRKYLKVDFQDQDKDLKTLDDLAPPKLLAIFRAVAWIKKLNSEGSWPDSFSFDSAKLEHNLMPSISEMNRIYNYLTRIYGNKNGPFRPETLLDTPPSTPPQHSTGERSTCIVSPTLVSFTPTASYRSPIECQTPQYSNVDVKINGHTFSSECWSKALRKYRLEDGAEKAGKFLFEETFTDEEIAHHTISGRGGKPKLSEVKISTILKALEVMNGIVSNSKPIPLVNSERKNLTKKIFTEHPNYLRRRERDILTAKKN